MPTIRRHPEARFVVCIRLEPEANRPDGQPTSLLIPGGALRHEFFARFRDAPRRGRGAKFSWGLAAKKRILHFLIVVRTLSGGQRPLISLKLLSGYRNKIPLIGSQPDFRSWAGSFRSH